MEIVKALFMPLLTYGLYNLDLLTDLFNTITLLQNCHPKYAILSICIMLSSYITTVLYLKFQMEHKMSVALFYPFQHSKNLLKIIRSKFLAVIRSEIVPKETEEEELYMENIAFIEANSESVLQLCLSCVILREFGTSTDSFQRFFQLFGLFTSLISIVVAFAKVRYTNISCTVGEKRIQWNTIYGAKLPQITGHVGKTGVDLPS